MVTFTTEVAGSLEDFDKDLYRGNLALLLDGISESDIDLTVTSASVLVTSRIAAYNSTHSDGIVRTLAGPALNSTAALSQALGHSIVRIEAPAVEVVVTYLGASHNLTKSPTNSGTVVAAAAGSSALLSSSSETSMLVIIVVIMACAIIILGSIVLALFCQNRRLRGSQRNKVLDASSAPMAMVSATEAEPAMRTMSAIETTSDAEPKISYGDAPLDLNYVHAAMGKSDDPLDMSYVGYRVRSQADAADILSMSSFELNKYATELLSTRPERRAAGTLDVEVERVKSPGRTWPEATRPTNPQRAWLAGAESRVEAEERGEAGEAEWRVIPSAHV